MRNRIILYYKNGWSVDSFPEKGSKWSVSIGMQICVKQIPKTIAIPTYSERCSWITYDNCE